MDIGFIILVGIVTFGIATLVAILIKGPTSKAAGKFVMRPPLIGTTDPRKSGYWYSTNWFLGEKVNDAISAGKERNSHKRSRHRR